MGLKSQTKQTAYRSPSLVAFSILTFVGFNQNTSKGWISAGDQWASFLSLSFALSKLHEEPWESRTWAKTACSQPLGFQNLTSPSCSSSEQNHTPLRPPLLEDGMQPSEDANPSLFLSSNHLCTGGLFTF